MNSEVLQTMAAKKTTKKAAANKTPAKKATAKKAAAAKTTKKAAAKKTAAAKTTKKAPAKKAAATKTTKKAAATKAPASKKASQPAKASPPEKPRFGQKFLDAQRALLLKERERYVKSAATWKAEADALVESREPGDVQFDEESGEGDSLAVERERDLVLSANAKNAVEQIDAALVRLDKGTYGVCIGSGKAIPKERLEAIPWAAERVEYKAAGFGRR